MSYIVAILSWCAKQNDKPHVILTMPFNLSLVAVIYIIVIPSANTILVVYVILCILSYDFNK